jgi:hypothetical protein
MAVAKSLRRFVGIGFDEAAVRVRQVYAAVCRYHASRRRYAAGARSAAK